MCAFGGCHTSTVGSLEPSCTTLPSFPPLLPSQPHSAEPSPWRRDYPLPCLSEVGRGSQHGACHAWACPLLPARPFSSAQHSRDSRTEPEANLIPPHSSSEMISRCFQHSWSKSPNEVKWMPVRPKAASSWKQYTATVFAANFCSAVISVQHLVFFKDLIYMVNMQNQNVKHKYIVKHILYFYVR